jgi:hypothetical protein
MKGFVQDIESLAIKNEEFRRVLYTAKHCPYNNGRRKSTIASTMIHELNMNSGSSRP